MRVRVYFNLHKKVFSVQDKKTRKVIGHTEHIILENVKFIVSESGRQRVLREKKKNVHAFVEGDVLENGIFDMKYSNVTYNPYRDSTFMYSGKNTWDYEIPARSAKRCYMQVAYKKPFMYAV